MAAVRALLLAVLGGFVGAAPAAPVVQSHGALGAATQKQKNERPLCEAAGRPDATVAAAPPHAGGTPAAVAPTAIAPRPFADAVATILAGSSHAVPPPSEDVRAGLLDLPPPAR